MSDYTPELQELREVWGDRAVSREGRSTTRWRELSVVAIAEFDRAIAKVRADAAEAKVAVVRELHTKEKHGVRWHCGECLQDDNTGSWEYVEWPCPTIRALNGVPNA